MIDYYVFQNKAHFEEEAPKFLTRIGAFWNFDTPLVLQYSPWKNPRTRSQLGLYRIWLREMAQFFSNRDHQFSEDDMHDLMRHEFLGYEERTIGSTQLQPQLKSTADGRIGKLAMSEYMTKVDAWAADKGCYLPRPEDNEYTRYKEART